MKYFDSLLSYSVWCYFIATLLALALLYLGGDRWWPGTLLLFGPRWMLALPLIPLLLLALWRRRRLLVPLLLGGFIVGWPFMGLRWSFFAPKLEEGAGIRVLTCNVRTGIFNSQLLSDLIRTKNVDLVALQECPPSVQLNLPPGWQKAQAGQLMVISKFPIQAFATIQAQHPPHIWPRDCLLSCLVTTPQGKLIFYSVHLPSPRYGLQHVLDRKTGINLQKAELLVSETRNRVNAARTVRNTLKTGEMPFVLAGDFNTPVESSIYQEVWADLQNAFSMAGRGYGWSFLDSVSSIPINVRLDQILTGNGAVPLACEVGPDVGSDHRPVIADILIPRVR